MDQNNLLMVAKSERALYILPQMANRHGLIAGATGTGKTVTLKVLAESFSDIGVPVLLTDIKGDLAGLAVQGGQDHPVAERAERLEIPAFEYKSYPVTFWDLFAEAGHPVRTMISTMGPLLLSRLLALNETQAAVLNIVFRIADDKELLLIDFKDLRAMIQYVGDHAKEFSSQYGTISAQSNGAILRRLFMLEEQGAEHFFGEPALNVLDWMRQTNDGHGMVNILHCAKLYQMPMLYSTFLLWMLSELFEALPEVGDLDKPKMVIFFDEAHLLFTDAPQILLQKIEQVVRLIRSRGVGIYFVTQNPADLPEAVLGQLGNRIQHALRAYTPAEQRKLRAAAQSFRANPAFDTGAVITELATGEALVSFLDEQGIPSIVERAFIMPPRSELGTIDAAERSRLITASSLSGKYDQLIDRASAYELLQVQAKEAQLERKHSEERKAEQKQSKRTAPKRSQQSMLGKAANAALTTIGRELGRSIVRGILGSLRK